MENALTPVQSPRLVVAGLAGDSGKSLVTLGLVRALHRRGLAVAPFKKGPDFIDAAWLGAAACAPGRNLDTFMMTEETVLRSCARAARDCDVTVVEGNRGLYDGLDARGTQSTAQLAKLLRAPVVLVVDITKTSRTAAALVLGCQAMDPDLVLAGVILNRCGTPRQEALVREAVETTCGLPVLGALPRLEHQHLPGRHLGLVTMQERPDVEEVADTLAGLVEQQVDVSRVLELARRAPELPVPAPERESEAPVHTVRIGILKDRAFSFYYPENLEALEDAGADLVPFSPLEDEAVPRIDALYAGGGFPEVYARGLSQNRPMRAALRGLVAAGLPVWAECGGLMYLARSVVSDGTAYPMVGALPGEVELTARPQGHGYVEASVDRPNPFLRHGTTIRGHEFHYSRLRLDEERPATVLAVNRGVGLGHGRDGVAVANVVAGYTHVHALGVPTWAEAVVRAAREGKPRAET